MSSKSYNVAMVVPQQIKGMYLCCSTKISVSLRYPGILAFLLAISNQVKIFSNSEVLNFNLAQIYTEVFFKKNGFSCQPKNSSSVVSSPFWLNSREIEAKTEQRENVQKIKCPGFVSRPC